MTAPDAVRVMLHEMTQPAAAASLAVDVALHELQQGQVGAARARLAAAADQLAALRGQMRRHAAAGLGASADHPSAVLLRHALLNLMRAPGPATLRCRVEPAGEAGALRIHLAGGAAPDAALLPWLGLLRAAGAQVACRRARSAPGGAGSARRLRIDISLPPGIS